MSFISLDVTKLQVGKPAAASIMQQIKDNEDALNAGIETSHGLNVPNGSFEIDSDADGVPDLWTVSYYPGGSGAIETADPIHGAAAWKFVHPGGAGNGGGYMDSDYLPINGSSVPWLIFRLKCSVAGMKNLVQIRYFTAAKVFISSEDLYNSTSNPTSWQQFGGQGTAPATARFARVRLIGGYSDTDVAGNIYFDDVDLLQRNHDHDGMDSKKVVAGNISLDYESAWTSIAAANSNAFAHGLGAAPTVVLVWRSSSSSGFSTASLLGQVLGTGNATFTGYFNADATNITVYNQDGDTAWYFKVIAW